MLYSVSFPRYTWFCDLFSLQTHVDMFCGVLLESLATGESTIECEYASLLLSIDRLQHPLLQGLEYLRDRDKGNFIISFAEFPALRLPILKGPWSRQCFC